jgi:hypothetical protein
MRIEIISSTVSMSNLENLKKRVKHVCVAP